MIPSRSAGTLISICIPCMGRAHDLKRTMPSLIAAAKVSPPVEIAVLDYNSGDDLYEYMREVAGVAHATNEVGIQITPFYDRDYYHMAHARNLSVLASTGEYAITLCADIIMEPDYLTIVRRELAKGRTWLHHSDRFVGVVCISRLEFVDAGGYDERFEFYGKEDKDLLARLKRRGAPHAQIPDRLSLIYTPWPEKLKNYRLPLTRRQASKRSKAIWQENIDNAVLVANEGKEWGQWA